MRRTTRQPFRCARSRSSPSVSLSSTLISVGLLMKHSERVAKSRAILASTAARPSEIIDFVGHAAGQRLVLLDFLAGKCRRRLGRAVELFAQALPRLFAGRAVNLG